MDRRLCAGLLAMICAGVILLAAVRLHTRSAESVAITRQNYLTLQQRVAHIEEERRLYERYWPRYQRLRRRGVIGGRLSALLADLDKAAQSLPLDNWRYSWQPATTTESDDLLAWTLQIDFVSREPDMLLRLLAGLETAGSGVLQPESCLLRQADGSVRTECRFKGAALAPPDHSGADGAGHPSATAARVFSP